MPSTRLIATLATATLALTGTALAGPASAATRGSDARVPAGISVPLPPPSAPALVGLAGSPAPSTCRGVPATDIVDPGDDFVGSGAAEVIVVLGPGSDVRGEGGNDTICVHGSHVDPHSWSTIYGGEGDDIILGVSGALMAYGDAGQDVILGNGTEMYLYGGDGNDHINAGGATSSIIDAGGWQDSVTGSPGPDVIQGGQGDDGLYGWDGDDDIDGGDGYDHIVGGHGFDDLVGGAGWGTDHCYDYANSAVHGADISDCVAHLTPLTPDGIVFG